MNLITNSVCKSPVLSCSYSAGRVWFYQPVVTQIRGRTESRRQSVINEYCIIDPQAFRQQGLALSIVIYRLPLICCVEHEGLMANKLKGIRLGAAGALQGHQAFHLESHVILS